MGQQGPCEVLRLSMWHMVKNVLVKNFQFIRMNSTKIRETILPELSHGGTRAM